MPSPRAPTRRRRCRCGSRRRQTVTAKGADPDTLVASAKAYLGALNKLMVKRSAQPSRGDGGAMTPLNRTSTMQRPGLPRPKSTAFSFTRTAASHFASINRIQLGRLNALHRRNAVQNLTGKCRGLLHIAHGAAAISGGLHVEICSRRRRSRSASAARLSSIAQQRSDGPRHFEFRGR